MNEHTAYSGVALSCGAGFVDLLPQINAALHTIALIVGIGAGTASIIYYWTNRKSQR